MAKFYFPDSDRKLLAFLNRTIATRNSDAEAGVVYVSQAVFNEVVAFAPVFEARLLKVAARLDDRVRETAESQQANGRFQTYVRDFWEVLRRRQRRQNEPETLLHLYGLALDGKNPDPLKQDDWFTLGKTLIQGDAAAVAAGYEAMSNPSAAQIAQMLLLAQKEAAEAVTADRALDEEMAALADDRARARRLVEDILADIRHNGRRLEAASLRRIVRAYGGTYLYAVGEPRDEDDPVPSS